MSKKYKDKMCAYCGINLSTTADHVFSRSLFCDCDPEIVHIPQVPACFECNNEKSRLEHILSTILPFGGRHESAKKHLSNGKVGKRLSKNIPLKLKIKKALEKSARETSENESLSMELPEELKMLKEYFISVVKGLSFFHWQLYLTNNVKIEVDYLTEEGRRYYEYTYFKMKWVNMAKNSLDHNTISYIGILGYDKVTVWLFDLYGGLQVKNSRYQNTISSVIGVITSSNV